MEITNVTTFLEYYEKLRGRTLRVIQCIPPDKFDWTHRAGKFTFADLIRHLAASERFMFAENVRGNKSLYPGHGKELADGYDNVLRFFSEMHDESMQIFRGLSDEDLQNKCPTPGDAPITIWKWLRALAEHEIHHRGQIYAYLGMLGIPAPPLYGLTSEKVRERSK
ncbi:MAG: DinB family protein [Acidobacteria bacterium]|jgi:uncharacterized damage-inducible protein DinB|nr:DinB family protein [Acidobacteriota bacterium]